MSIIFDPAATSIKAVTYAVKTTGDAMFQPTIGTSDSPDYTADKTAANAQAVIMSPLAEEVVG